MYFILFYDYIEGVLERRAPHRNAHLALVKEYADKGAMILAGAYADPVDGAALIFKVEDREEVEAFAGRDPYVANGLVRHWWIREWTVVAGAAMQ